ncbi:hypothetical protein ACCD10_29485 [Pseudomonas sp. Pseusp122]|uniref:hypothetical protein n=1 Tax=unclassified Pseudomonas TaxID=196821 RepID=UPI0039A4257C
MIRFKNTLPMLGLLFSFAATAQNNGKGCALDVSRSKLEVSSCTQTRGVTIWKLIPRDQPPPSYEQDLGFLPTFILAGDDLDVILKLMNDGDSPYNNFIRLPGPEEILSTTIIPGSAKATMEKINWRLTNTTISTYKGAGDNEGPFVVCGTYDRKGTSDYVVVSQCNSYDKKDRSELKDLLDLLEVQFK